MVTPIVPLIPRVIIGLGNPEPRFTKTRHNIGFQVVDALADKYGASWHSRQVEQIAHIEINGVKVMLIKPQTFMNNSGDIVPFLKKRRL